MIQIKMFKYKECSILANFQKLVNQRLAQFTVY